jgi:hypothetical protein
MNARILVENITNIIPLPNQRTQPVWQVHEMQDEYSVLALYPGDRIRILEGDRRLYGTIHHAWESVDGVVAQVTVDSCNGKALRQAFNWTLSASRIDAVIIQVVR